MSKNPFKTEKSEEKAQEIQEDIKDSAEADAEKEEVKSDEPSEYDKLNQQYIMEIQVHIMLEIQKQ